MSTDIFEFWAEVAPSDKRDAGSALRPIPASAPHFVPDLAAEISRLRRENDRLRMERDILKKAVAIFSEPPR
jgi:transposase